LRKELWIMGPTAEDFVFMLSLDEVDPAASFINHEDLMTNQETSTDGATFLEWYKKGHLSKEPNRGAYVVANNSGGNVIAIVHNFYSEGYGSSKCSLFTGRSSTPLTVEIYNANCSSEED
jgi:hypothetical protein